MNNDWMGAWVAGRTLSSNLPIHNRNEGSVSTSPFIYFIFLLQLRVFFGIHWVKIILWWISLYSFLCKHIRIKYLAAVKNHATQKQRSVFLKLEDRGERKREREKPSTGLSLKRIICTKRLPQKPGIPIHLIGIQWYSSAFYVLVINVKRLLLHWAQKHGCLQFL